MIGASTTSVTGTAQIHEVAFGILERFPKQGVFKGGKLFMRNVQETISSMSTEFDVVPSCVGERVKCRIRRRLEPSFPSEDEIDGKNRDSPGNQLRHRIDSEELYRRLERHSE